MKYLIDEQTLVNLADAIRYKSGINETLTPLEMIETINGLTTTTEKPLNFDIVGSTTQPVSPTENTIWINTEIAIGEYQFSASAPMTRINGTTLQTGDIWVIVNNGSSIKFNAIKQNSIEMKISGCMQYINSTWTTVDEQIYQDSVWKDFGTYYLSASTPLTGTWKQVHTQGGTVNCTTGTDNILQFSVASTSVYQNWVYQDPIDVTNFNTMFFTIRSNSLKDQATDRLNGTEFGLSSSASNLGATSQGDYGKTSIENLAVGTYQIDISTVSGNAYLYAGLHYGIGTFEISDIWFI